MTRRRRIDGDEQDAFSRRWRHIIGWTQRAGARKRVKRRTNRRERREGRTEALEQYREAP